MSDPELVNLSGGCQCGAMRFKVTGTILQSSVCHCRMCQKCTGAVLSGFAKASDFAWTRGGAPKYFQTSEFAKRGFCPECGTQLTYEPHGKPVRLIGVMPCGQLERVHCCCVTKHGHCLCCRTPSKACGNATMVRSPLLEWSLQSVDGRR